MAIINGCCGFGNSYNFVKTEYNFDVDGEWSVMSIASQSEFNAALGVTTDAFELKGNNIKARITSVTYNELDFSGWNVITNVNYITVEGLLSIVLRGNRITEFNPSKKLPFDLENLGLNNNQLQFFSPDLPIPSGLVSLNLEENQFRTIGYAASESWANNAAVNVNTTVYFTNNIDSVSGTNLETILSTQKGWTVVA
jgi:Leucine-rich repeat (LRR) protein